MFKWLICLLLSVTAINGSLPNINSFMPNFFGLIPMNGQISLNDQVFTFGDPSLQQQNTQNTVQSVTTQEVTDIVGPQNPITISQTTGSFPITSQNVPIVDSNEPTIQQNSDSRIPDFLLTPVVTNTQPINRRIPDFSESQIPSFGSFGSRDFSFDSQTNHQRPQEPQEPLRPNFQLPNIGSTELGSTFASNSRSNFADEFSNPSSGSSNPFGGLSNNQFQQPMSGQSNFNSAERPLEVMPLIVSPDRLLQNSSIMTSRFGGNPTGGMFASASDVDEHFQTVKTTQDDLLTNNGNEESNKNPILISIPHDSVTISRESSFSMPEPTIRQVISDEDFHSNLTQHLPSILFQRSSDHIINGTDSQPTVRFNSSGLDFPFEALFQQQILPTLSQFDDQMTQNEQLSTPQMMTTTSSSISSNQTSI